MKYYTINQVATMTGLTTRTLRNYINSGVLNGEKIEGVWQFSEEDLSAMVSNPMVKPSIQAKHKGVVFDFLAEEKKRVNEICMILDLHVSHEEAEEVSEFFCSEINRIGDNVVFKYEYDNGNARVILSGPEDSVAQIMREDYR